MTIFDIEFPELVRQLLPVRLRQGKMLRWLQCLIAPTLELYLNFTLNRNANIYVLKHSSQIAYMQAVLNDAYDPILRRIYINDGLYTDSLFVFLIDENEPLWLGMQSEIGSTLYQNPNWLFTRAETLEPSYCFVVNVPIGLVYDEVRLRALVDKYRLPSKNYYNIEIV